MSTPDAPRPVDRPVDQPVDWPAGWIVREVVETGSTNADLLARAESAPDRTVLRADHQTAGRGRLDRTWEAPAGANLLFSALFRTVPADPGELTRRVGLSVVDAAHTLTGAGASLKWPNDILVAGGKLAGILAQRAPNGVVVVGVGVNLGWAPEGAARLPGVTPQAMLAGVLRAFDALPVDVSQRYRERLGTLGQRVRIERSAGDLVGTAIDVDGQGRLVVLDECAISHRIDAGDVTHLRPA